MVAWAGLRGGDAFTKELFARLTTIESAREKQRQQLASQVRRHSHAQFGCQVPVSGPALAVWPHPHQQAQALVAAPQDVVESGRARESVLAPSSSSHHGAHSAAEGSRLTAASSKARRLSVASTHGASTHGASTHASTQLAPPPKTLLPALEEEQHGVQVRTPRRRPAAAASRFVKS